MKWIVHTKGKANERSFEIAVIKEDNKHGILSYGWFGKDKLLISHNGGPCSWPVTSLVWNKLIRVANEIAEELNKHMNKLKPCPSCGGKGEMLKTQSDPDEGVGMGYDWYQVVCECGWRACPFESYNGGEESAIKSWNTRTE